MTYAESPFWLVCLSGSLGLVVLAFALYRFATFNRADNGGVRGDVPENPTPITAPEDDNPRMIITNGRMTRVIEREDK